ncbi:hypothetical protein [Anabaena azotica]|uniref:hypothetical protein n=1 Tax=Anabaena azotica TaxID=197653 RepID=UPI0039A686BE
MFEKLKKYEQLLQRFIEKGYNFSKFSESITTKKQLLLRHDIDFDISLAHEMSCLEDSLGVKATYFFMIRSKSYNLLLPENVEIIQSLKERGHQISIHFDPTIYEDFFQGFQWERNIFEQLFNVKVNCISIHRPIEYFLGNNDFIDGIRHTYQPIYFQDIKYFSDSHGEFRYGHPLDSQEFLESRSIQLLIHPIWWVTNQTNSINILTEFVDYRIELFQQHIASNCKPYQKYVEGIRANQTAVNIGKLVA